MMRQLLLGIWVSLVTITPVYAFNLSFMDYSSVYYFTPGDWSISKTTAMKTLNTGRDNVKVSWRNPETKAHGYFIPSDTKKQNGTICRQMEIFSNAHDVTGKSSYHFCKIKGEWRITN